MASIADEDLEASPDDAAPTECLVVFAQRPEAEASLYVDTRAPACRCEPVQVSTYSATPVDDDETLIRLIVDNIHIKQVDGETRVRESFLEDSIHGGASCLRLGRASKDEFQRTIDLLIKGKVKPSGEPREVIGYVRIPAKIARAMHVPRSAPPIPKPPEPTPEFRAFAVYATGEADRPNHSDVMLCNHAQFSNSAKNRHAATLGKQVSYEKVTSVEDVLKLGVS